MDLVHTVLSSVIKPVERLNILKQHWPNIAKKPEILPHVLLRVHCTPCQCGYSPFEILLGHLLPLIPKDSGFLRELRHTFLWWFLKDLAGPAQKLPPSSAFKVAVVKPCIHHSVTRTAVHMSHKWTVSTHPDQHLKLTSSD